MIDALRLRRFLYVGCRKLVRFLGFLNPLYLKGIAVVFAVIVIHRNTSLFLF